METEEGFVYTIKGTKVIFPCKAYPTQLSMMDKVMSLTKNITFFDRSLLIYRYSSVK